jgi:hypothetical protein
VESLDGLLNLTMRNEAKVHREYMIKEFKRREEKKKEEVRQ